MLKIISKLLPQSTRSSLSLKIKVLYSIDLNFKSSGQALYTANQNHIERFFSNRWEKEIFVSTEESLPLKFKTFINTSNLHHLGLVHMSIYVDDKIVSDKTFTIERHEFEYTGWLELTYNG
jgi:hypothetical protein